ncbi:nucleolin-like isoform X2 [Liolophura sinensis]|uniref:nucleolin-like isoform X2 n=1 Tax=Liolophura sinensis TaxID=3198878 RepID=UPI00315984BB
MRKNTPTKAAEPTPEESEAAEGGQEEAPVEGAADAGNDVTEQMVTDDLPVTTEDEVNAMNEEEEEEGDMDGAEVEGEGDMEEMQATEDPEEEGGEGDEEDEEGDEEEEEGDDDDEEEEDEDADTTGGSKQAKRKKAQAGNKAKKAKVDEAVCMNVYVTRSPSEKAFNEMFQKFLTENDLEVKEITRNDERKWELFGMMELKKQEDVEKFMSLCGQEVGGREVKFEEIKESNIDGLTAPAEKVLFIGNIPKTTTVSDLRTLYPTAKEIFFPMSRHGEKRGFVFIELESKEEVDEMIKTRQGEKLEGNELSIGRYIPKKKNRALTKKQNGDSTKKVLFIGNLNYNTTQEKLKEFFTNAESARILMHPRNKRSKGVGFIEFRTPQDAQKALKNYNGAIIDEREIFLEFADHEPSTAADYKGRFDTRGGRQGSGGFRQSFNRPNFGGGYGGGGAMNFGGNRFMNDYESRLLQSRFGGYGFGGQMGFEGGFGGNMGGYRSNFNSGNQGGYGQRYGQGSRNFKNNRGNSRGGRRF